MLLCVAVAPAAHATWLLLLLLPLLLRTVGRSETPDGIEIHMQTNHLAHFLLTLGLIPALHRAAQQQQQQSRPTASAGPHDSTTSTRPTGFMPRVVQVASAMHQFGYKLRQDPLQQKSYSAQLAYGNSKMAQVGTCGPQSDG